MSQPGREARPRREAEVLLAFRTGSHLPKRAKERTKRGRILKIGASAAAAWSSLSTRPALAHAESIPAGPEDLWSAWSLDPFLLAGFAAAFLAYGIGVGRLWQRAGPGRGVAYWEVASLTTGMAVFFLAMIWPLDALGEVLFSAHMTQHVVLTAVVPPLIWLGRPVAMLWILPAAARETAGGWVGASPVRRGLRWLTHPVPAFLLEAVVLWGWHAPAAIDLALRNEAVHWAMHASFLVAGMLFWRALAYAGRKRASACLETAVLSFLTMMHSGVLGALLTFAPRPLYLVYGDRPLAWGLTLLEDQQLAGLVMWVICGTIYIVAGVALLATWFRDLERQNPSAGSFAGDGGA